MPIKKAKPRVTRAGTSKTGGKCKTAISSLVGISPPDTVKIIAEFNASAVTYSEVEELQSLLQNLIQNWVKARQHVSTEKLKELLKTFRTKPFSKNIER